MPISMYVNKYDHERSLMVEQQLIARGIKDAVVLRAMSVIPREKFVPDDQLEQAYQDSALPIGKGQTISQPYIVALMTQALRVKPEDKVLEIGTGSGYQAAVLAELAAEVYSIELVPELYRRTRKLLLKDLQYANIKMQNGSGRRGWETQAPFNKIIVTAVADKVPPALWQQLAINGRLVIPLKFPDGQKLMLIKKDDQGNAMQENLLDVVFVPLK